MAELDKICTTGFENRYLEEILELWNQCLPYDLINRERFETLITGDDNFRPELCRTALYEGTVAGFIWAVRRRVPYLTRGLEESRGWINYVVVRPDFRRIGVGTRLVRETEKRMAEHGVREITLCAYSPNYLTPGIDIRYESGIRFFEKLGYIYKDDAVSMQRSLWDYYLSDAAKKKIQSLKEEGIRIIPYEEKYKDGLFEFLGREFGAGWLRNAMLAVEKREAEETVLICVDGQERILGFCMRKIDGNDARFGPIGVDESLRSKGLGGVLLDMMMEDMKKRAIYYLFFLWTGGAGQRFYERHGIHPYRSYRLYRKEI